MNADRITRQADVVIAGGGASGLAAAIELGMKAPQLEVLVIEKMEEPGRKLKATGSGRCNISNTTAEGYDRIKEFFNRIGLVTKEYDNGLVYPYSESAADVVNLLTDRANSLGVKFACSEELMSVRYLPADLAAEPAPGSDNVFLLESVYKDRDGLKSITTTASFVILAMGGKAGPTFGTIGDGYRIARNLGHRIVTPVPVLTGIECDEWSDGKSPCGIELAGTRTRGIVTLYEYDRAGNAEAKELFSEEGEIQFTKYGLSGICVFNMTRHMRYNRSAGESLSKYLIYVDLYPEGRTEEHIRNRRDHAFPGEMTSDILRTVLKENLASYVLGTVRAHGIDAPDKPVSELTDEDIFRIGDYIHSFIFHPAKIRGWNDAQATSGGVSLDEINAETSESQLIKGMYISGELADRDFPCGGFNLSNAWITGLAAADDISRRSSASSAPSTPEANILPTQ